MALYLKESQVTWDQSGKSNISCITFAGPTAGNVAFAAYSDSLFNGGPYPPNWDSSLGSTFDAVRCNYDVAPQAWIASNLYQDSGGSSSSPLFQTYGSNLDFANGLGLVSGMAWSYIIDNMFPPIAAILAKPDYQQPVAAATQLQGTYNPEFAPASDGLTDYLKAFEQQAAWQHGNSYPAILGVPALLDRNIIRVT